MVSIVGVGVRNILPKMIDMDSFEIRLKRV